jgi:hypothetical protein
MITAFLGTVLIASTAVAESPTIQLRELWRIGGDADAPEEVFGTIQQIACDDSGCVYVLDSQLNSLKRFSPEGAYQLEVAHEGDGPGELRTPLGMFFTPEGDIGIYSYRRTCMLGRDGTFKRAIPFPETIAGLERARGLGDGLVYATVTFDRHEAGYTATTYLGRCDAGGREQVRFAEQAISRKYANFELTEDNTNDWRQLWAVGPGDRIYSPRRFTAYEIEVWSADGTLERTIRRDYEPLPRTAVEMEEARTKWERLTRGVRGATAVVSKTHRAIERIFPRADGSLWVLNSRGARRRPRGTVAQLDVFDGNGRFVHQVALLGPGDAARDALYLFEDRAVIVVGDDPTTGEPLLEPNTILCCEIVARSPENEE